MSAFWRVKLLQRIRIGAIAWVLLAVSLPAFPAPKFVTQSITSGVVNGTTWIVHGDFNRDGYTDFAAGNHKRSSPTLAWYPGPKYNKRYDLNPAFVKSYDMMGNTSDGAVGDINNDGWLDIIVPTSNASGAVYWMENPRKKSGGIWKAHKMGYFKNRSYHFADVMAGDMDRDGKLDVVTRDVGDMLSSFPKFRVFFQNSPDSWEIRTFNTYPREGATLHDVDKDGNLDIVGNGFWYRNPGKANARTAPWPEMNIHTFHYKQKAAKDGGHRHNNSSKVAFGDLNGDKIDDVVLSTAEGDVGRIAWYTGPKNPTAGKTNWVEHKLQTGYGKTKTDWQLGHTLYLGDIDNDGDLDIMSGVYKVYGSLPRIVFVWYNNGNAKSWTRVQISDKGIYQGDLFDAENDGDLDIFGPWTNNKESPIYWHKNLLNPPGGGKLEDTTLPMIALQEPRTVQSVSFDIHSFNGVIRFSFPRADNCLLGIVDLHGRQILTIRSDLSGSLILPAKNLAPGFYLGNLRTRNRQYVKRFIMLQ